ncbi:MAG: hypothetical protein ABL903_20365 [Methylococcales bacterium]|nr:hypothetical protein [Methylotenera sp.]
MRLFITALILFASATSAIAADEDLNICNAGGYYAGAQDRFMSGIAQHILQKRGLLGTVNCSALWKSAYEVGASFSRTGKIANQNEAEILKQASTFSEKVYSNISTSMGY